MEKMKILDHFNAFRTLQSFGIDLEKVCTKGEVSQNDIRCLQGNPKRVVKETSMHVVCANRITTDDQNRVAIQLSTDAQNCLATLLAAEVYNRSTNM